MILTYSLDRFVPAILDGTKKHTIRTDPHRRWRAGMYIQHWSGNPRNVRNNPYQFGTGLCHGVQEIEIWRMRYDNPRLAIIVDGRLLTDEENGILAANDGLTVEDLREWFMKGEVLYVGRIIHFTELRY